MEIQVVEGYFEAVELVSCPRSPIAAEIDFDPTLPSQKQRLDVPVI
jgi:hypothetical protein